jgi:hypothetical protein
MKSKLVVVAAVVSYGLLLSSAVGHSQDVTIDFTGVANPNVQVLGAYAGYYTGTVNGVAASPGFICDDYNNEIYLPSESWQATTTSFASLVSGNTANTAVLDGTLFGKTIGLDGYAALAYLSNSMAGTSSVTGQEDIAAAIWYIGALGTGSYSNPDGLGTDSIAWSSLSTSQQNLVTSLLGSSSQFGAVGGGSANAITELDSSSVSNLFIYTPIPGTQPSNYGLPQEFIGDPINTPEGGSTLLYLLVAVLFCTGVLLLRRQGFVSAANQ